MKVKFLGVILIVCILLLQMPACSLKLTPGQVENSRQAGTGETEINSRNTIFSKRLTITMPHIHGDKAGRDPMYEFISNKFNIDIIYIPVTWDNWNQKCNVWIASGNLPDILWWDLRAHQYAKFAEWCREGVFKEIPELDDRFSNLKRVLELMPVTENFRVDGKRYVIPHYTEYIEMEGMGGVQFYYRKDWAIKLGMDKDVFTYEDMKRFVKACIEQDPGNNGPGATIGIVGPTWAVPDHVFMMEGSPYFASYVKKDGKYVWGAALPETLEGIKISRELYDEGIINKDFYAVNDLDGEKQFLNGKAAILVGTLDASQLLAKRDNIKMKNPELDPNTAVAPMKLLGPHGKTLVEEEYGFWSATSFNPNIEDEKLERILYYMDWCCTNEAGEYMHYGVKGKDWDIVNGEFKLYWKTDESGVKQKPYYLEYAAIYMHLGTNGGHFPYSLNRRYDEKLLKDIGEWVQWRKSAPQSVRKVNPELDFLVTPNKSKYGSFAQDVKDQIKRLIISSDNIEKDWSDWLEYMRPKVEPILEELNSALATGQ